MGIVSAFMLYGEAFMSMRRFVGIVAAVCAAGVGCGWCAAQQGVPEVRLEAHEGKTDFYLGDPIRLDLVFANHTGSAFSLNLTEYGDLSEKVEISPGTGWFQWQTPSGHDYFSEAKLGDAPERIPVWLDEGFVFREAGEYRVKVTTSRLMRGSQLGGAVLGAMTTNEVTIRLEAMPAAVETARLEEIRAVLGIGDDSREGDERKEAALRKLATLQGDAALEEKIKLLEDGDDDFRGVYREAFATTRDWTKQLALLKEAWTDPKLTPRYDTPDALTETRMLLAGRNVGGWQMGVAPRKADAVDVRLGEEHHADMVGLLDSMAARGGESRADGAYYLIEFEGLTEAERARAVDYAVEEFPHMDDTEQHMLLETARPPLRDVRLVPAVRAMLAANPADRDATAALLAMAPEDSTAWIATAVCAPKGVVLLDTFAGARVDRVPEVDACLAPLLRVAPATPQDEFNWKQRAVAAARFGSVGILGAVGEGWKKPSQDGAVLAVMMRDDPAGAVELLKKEDAAGTLQAMLFFETGSVYKQVPGAFPDVVLGWLRGRLDKGTDKEAGVAAYALSLGGDGSDEGRVEARLERVRMEGQELTGDARQAENELASVLGLYGAKTFLADAGRRRELGLGCRSDGCRFSLH
jgi:hypothetical protein